MQLDREDVIRLFTGLGDAMRLEIIFLLGEHERLNVGEIAAHFQLSRPAISHHLKVLKDAGVITDRRDGRWMWYNINGAVLDQIATYTRSVKPGKHAGSCALACC